MANGDSSGGPLPGFFVAGGIGVSNTAILVGALALGTAAFIAHLSSMNKQNQAMSMTDDNSMQQVQDDVYSYAAYPAQISQNHDRVQAAIRRAQSVFKVARDALKKKHKDLRIARQNGTITQEQYKAQIRIARQQFHTAIRTRWQEIHSELGVATKNHHINTVVPTLP